MDTTQRLQAVDSGRLATAKIVPYLGGRRSPVWDRIAARAAGVVARGKPGAAWLRASRRVDSMLDPATYEAAEDPDHRMPMLPLTDDPSTDAWLDRQRSPGVSQLLAPGVWVPQGELAVVSAYLERVAGFDEPSLVAAVLALEAGWLTEGVDALLDVVRLTDLPIAIVLGDPNDPLERSGSVRGLIALARELGPRLMVLRCDLAAIGAVAGGAGLGSVGTSSTVRHVVPPGKPAGGSRSDDSPSVLIREHLAFRRGSLLEQARDMGLRFHCSCDVCDGRSLDRFVDRTWADEAAEHSWLQVQAVAEGVLDAPVRSRLGAWRHHCAQAVATIEEHSSKARMQFGIPGALRQWAHDDY